MKRKYHQQGGGGARGYTPFGIETAKGAVNYDLKEFWHVARELPPGHKYERFDGAQPLARGGRIVQGHLPRAVRGVRHGPALKLLEAIARYLGLAPDYFVDTVKDGNSILRLLHYPPIPGDGPNVRAGAHEDINTITLLLGAEEAGLQLLDRDGDWLPVTPRPGELAVNIGDMLQRLTNNVLNRPPTGWSTRRPSGAASRATRCPSSSTSARIS